MSKEDNFKEKFKLALLSTANAIADDYSPNNDKKNKKKSKIDLFELDKLESRSDFVKYRAEIDSGALKRKFSNTEIFRNNFPQNSSYKQLYELSEKIRCEILGSNILKGVGANLKENYTNEILTKKKDQLFSKEDVSVIEAFELYMLKNFYKINLNSLNEKILSYWENDFDKSLKKQIMKIQTKSLSVDEVKNPNDCNVFKLYKIIASEDDVKNLSLRYTQGGLGYGEAKEILYSEIINKYAENRKKFFELMDDKQVVEDLLIDGAKKARVQAQKVLKRVRANVGY